MYALGISYLKRMVSHWVQIKTNLQTGGWSDEGLHRVMKVRDLLKLVRKFLTFRMIILASGELALWRDNWWTEFFKAYIVKYPWAGTNSLDQDGILQQDIQDSLPLFHEVWHRREECVFTWKALYQEFGMVRGACRNGLSKSDLKCSALLSWSLIVSDEKTSNVQKNRNKEVRKKITCQINKSIF